MTARTILSLAPRLTISTEETQVYIQKANGRRRRYTAGNPDFQKIQEIVDPKLTQMLEWYHIALLELVGVKGFQANAGWIADKLDIAATQAQSALDDLMSAGVISQREDGLWKSELDNHTVSSQKFPRMQLVKKQIYDQATALVPLQIGNHTTTTVSISEHRLGEALERITRFRRELTHFLSEPDDKEKVYQLVISLFPISK